MQLTWPRQRREALSLADAPPEPVTWRSLAGTYALAAAVTIVVALLAIGWGTVRIAPSTPASILLPPLHLSFVAHASYSPTSDAIIWDVRVPRVVLAGIVGATLAYAGAAYQGVFRNPLAEPYLIGVAA